ncbi:MAG: nucleotide disphospho-sugar-binding domain-containing protein, partial [Cyanobacteria bacterium J06573_11]
WRRVGCDRISVLRCYARQIGYSDRPLRWRGAGWRQWLVPYPHVDLSVLCMNASELDFPHIPHPKLHYVGPMVQSQRPQIQVSEQTQRQVMAFLAQRSSVQSSARALIYCSCSTFVKGNEHFLREVIAAVAARPQWELILGLGGQLSQQALGELPPRVHAFDWVPQMLLLQYADCAIHNGGINSLNECLYYGVPMLIYSLKRYDQDGNAARATYHGLGIAGDIEQDGAEQIGVHLQQLLNDRGYRQRAKAMSDRVHAYAQDKRAAKAIASILRTSGHRTSTENVLSISSAAGGHV